MSRTTIRNWVKRLHMYCGLLSFTTLIVLGIVGLTSTFLPRPGERPRPATQVQEVDFKAPGGLDDRQLADHIQAALGLPLTQPAPSWLIRRDADNRLRVGLPTPGHLWNIVVLEDESRLRLEKAPFDVWQYLFDLHEMTPSSPQPDWRTRAWAWYEEFTIWSLILMALSGVYLWLTSRPKWRWAQLSAAAGFVALLAIFFLRR